MKQDEMMVVYSYLQGTKKAVIERETDLLTPDELRTHRPAVEAAILEELRIWVKYQTFARHKRVGVQNIMSSKYVSKCKMIINKDDNSKKRIIRMRMTIRGFQDWFAHLDESYSGTA